MPIFNNILAGASGQSAGGAAAGYEIERSLRFDSSATSFLNRTPEAAGNRKTFTWSGWVKRAKLGTAQSIFTAGTNASTEYDTIEFASNDQIYIYSYSYPSFVYDLRTTQVFRDVSAWYHIVLSVDTTNSTANDRVKLYVNGVRVETFSTNSPPSQNVDSAYWNTANPHYIGYSISRFPADKYLADVHFLDGLTPGTDTDDNVGSVTGIPNAEYLTDFGEFDASGVWNPKQYTFGTNPNDGTTWSSDFTATSPGGYFSGSYPATNAFNGNLSSSAVAEPNGGTITFAPTGGLTVNTSLEIYRVTNSQTMTVSVNGGTSQSFGDGQWVDLGFTGTLTSLAITAESAANPQISAFRVDGYVLLDGAKNNSFHLPFSDNSSTIALGTDTSVTVSAAEANKGMDVVTYTGNSTARTINGLRFAPDFVWIKRRNSTQDHRVFDVIRGAEVGLTPNYTNGDYTATGELTAFNSDGFSLGTQQGVNSSGNTYVAWCWKAGGPAVTNTNGSITSQVSANQDYGFSIVTYSGNSTAGATIGHGLGSAPSFIITKMRTGPTGQGWQVGHASLGWTKRLYLQATNAENTSSGAWNDTAPTSSVFSAGISDLVNETGYTYVAYCWSEVSGFSKFGSYTGNGSSTGPTITTGFKPRFVLIKCSDSTLGGNSHWVMFDSARSGRYVISANLSDQEYDTGAGVSFTDTGFQIIDTNSSRNNNGNTYIYAAFASEPGNNWALNNFVANQTSTGFKPVLYTGDGASSRTISGLGFSPDLVWLKDRTNTGDDWSHRLHSSVAGADVSLSSNSTAGERDSSAQAGGGLEAFTSDGFTLQAGTSNNNNANKLNASYVAWCWDAGSSTVSNTDGTITSSVRANTNLGFSIATFTSPSSGNFTIGHGLAATPSVVIVKTTGATSDWSVYHASATTTTDKYLVLNSTAGVGTYSTIWGSALPTSSVVGLTSGGAVATSQTCVAYCFAPKPGVSAFGSYTGGTNPQTITTGFKPAFVLIKRTDTSNYWIMIDDVRGGDYKLSANTSNAENDLATVGDTAQNKVEFVSNGFKLTTTNAGTNTSGGTYIYMAFASAEDGAEVDSLLDSPTEANVDSDTGAGGEVSGNYCTLNPLNKGASIVLSNGNLTVSDQTSSPTRTGVSGTIAVTSGKWYFEGTAGSSTGIFGIGVAGVTASPNDVLVNPGHHYMNNGDRVSNGSEVIGYGSSYTTGDVIGVAYDADSGTVNWYKNNVAQGSVSFTPGVAVSPWVADTSGTNSGTLFNVNFGQRPWAYSAPSGYKALCTANLDDPTIADGSTAMDVVTYSSTNAVQAITLPGSGFQPDFVWTKSRSNNAYNHMVYDQVRGAGYWLYPDVTDAEGYDANTLKSFDTNGFTLGNSDYSNFQTGTSVAWCWDGGTAFSNSAGTNGATIASSGYANASAGFSIVDFPSSSTGGTVGHGLNVAPAFIICKNRDYTSNWPVYHSALGISGNNTLILDDTNAAYNSNYLTAAAPTSTVFSHRGFGATQTADYIAYCFAPVEGYSAFGSYTGNGSSDGPFVYTGFRPRWMLLRNADNTTGVDWILLDTARDTYNIADARLRANTSDQEGTESFIDITSNGFKVRTGGQLINGSGQTVIYAAFAEHPFKTARAR